MFEWKERLTPKPANWLDNLDWLGRKPGTYKWYEIQDETAYFPAFAQPKLIFPDIARRPRFALDRSGSFTDATTFIICLDDLFLLGVLNSKSVESFMAENSPPIRGGYLRFKRQYVEPIPVPNATAADKASIGEFVQHCIDAKGLGCEAWEQEIDERVASLYGLT